jgi:hypothetical protein
MSAACWTGPSDRLARQRQEEFNLLMPADYQRCITVRPGPIERPDGYTAHPYERKKDDA